MDLVSPVNKKKWAIQRAKANLKLNRNVREHETEEEGMSHFGNEECTIRYYFRFVIAAKELVSENFVCDRERPYTRSRRVLSLLCFLFFCFTYRIM